MFASQLGLRLILLLGDVPSPAPYPVMSALNYIKVISGSDGQDGFELRFTLGKDRSADYGLLAGGALAPDRRVIIGVFLGVAPEPLIDGVIQRHAISPGDEPGSLMLTVQGRDISVMLGLNEKNEKFENQTDSVIVMGIIAKYAKYGLVPQVTPTSDVPIELNLIPRQQEDDLAFLRRLAKKNGYVFYIEPLTIGTNSAYWGPESRLGAPQPALSTNMFGHTNVTSLNFSQDVHAPVGTEGSFIEPNTKTSIPIPPLPSLKMPPLAANPVSARRTSIERGTANKNPAQAALSAQATCTGAQDAVTATGQLDAARYGGILRPRRLVGVRGAGLSNNGYYYVESVTHDIYPGKSYTQSFKLKREGTGATVPVVLL